MNVSDITELSLSLDQGIKTRAELLDRINSSIRKLNTQFVANPEEINTQTLRELISELVEINRHIEEQKQGLKETWWSKHGEKVTILFFGLNFVGTIFVTTSTPFQFTPSLFAVDEPSTTTQSTSNCLTTAPATTSPNIFNSKYLQAITAIIIIGIVFQIIGGVGSVIANKKDKKEKEIRRNLDSVMTVKQVGEECLEKFLKTLEDFKNKPVEQRNEEQIKKCLRHIDKMPKDGLEKIKKEHFVPHMIEELPPSNPLFVNYAALKESVKRIPSEETYNDEDDEIPFGESISAAASMPNVTDLGSKSLPLNRRGPQDYKKLWGNIEGALGFKLTKINIDGKYLNRDSWVIEDFREIIPVKSDDTAVDIDEIAAAFDRGQFQLIGEE